MCYGYLTKILIIITFTCSMGQTLQFDNKRHINLTKILKSSCKVAIEHARTLKIIFPKDLKKNNSGKSANALFCHVLCFK